LKTSHGKTYGTLALDSPKRHWRIECEPHVMLRLKRLFASVGKRSHGVIHITDTEENCRDLEWFIERYSLAIAPGAHAHLVKQAAMHRERVSIVDALIDGRMPPTDFNAVLAHPARHYQLVASDIVLRGGSLLLADDVGLGKTLSAICTFTDPRTLPVLVVTLTHLPQQWANEIAKFAPSLRTHILTKGTPYDLTRIGGRGKQLGLSAGTPDVIIANYHKLTGWAETLAPVVRSVVFDECQELRRRGAPNDRSQKYAAAEHVARYAQFRMGLSATPFYNYGGEIWNVMNVLRPDGLGSESEFHTEWCSSAGDKPRIKDPQAFGTFMRESGMMIRRTRRDVGRELPPLSKVPHHVESDPAAIDKIAGSASELARIILRQGESHRGEKFHASEELSNKLRQATGIAKAPYVAEFVRLLVESGEKVVLYGWHHEVYRLWGELLRETRPVFYTGNESISDKEKSKQAFVKGEARVLVMSLRAGAGLDGLQGKCRTVVFGELDWSPGVHEQCVGRIYRDGQMDPVVAYFLVAEHGSDPIVADVLGLKKSQIDGLLDPHGASVERLEQGDGNIKRLAEAFLKQRGLSVPAQTAVAS
jgi:SNF2 family DNA or RNA helicase